ncbi:MAG: DoxX family protein [Cyclobacteriaceae bacterium]
MKKDRLIFWITTGIFGVMMLFSAFNYFFNEEVKSGFVHLGFPDYFRIELGIAKMLGALTLLLPMMPDKIKQFAYVGFTINLLSAAIAHMASGDPLSVSIMPLVFLGILAVSYIYYEKLKYRSAVKANA